MKGLLLSLVLVVSGCFPVSAGQEPYHVLPGHVIAQAARTPEHFKMWHFQAPIVPVTTPANKVLEPPPDPYVLGWWGRRAGALRGTTLLVGHSVHTGGGELHQLRHTPVGSIANVSGIRYRVLKTMVISPRQFAHMAPGLLSQTGYPKLVVVSCANYNWSTGIWESSAVVVAVPL